MNKNNRQKLILSAALLVAATASAFAQGNGIAGINEATSMAVSYTHLDVYKRQCASRSARSPFGGL